MINCPKCSKPNYDTDKYCASCGFKLYKEPAKKLNRVCLAGFLLLMTSVLMAAAFLATIFVFTEALSDMSTFGALIFIFVMFMIPLTFIAGLIVSIIGISISKKRGQSGSKLALGGIIGTAGTLTAGIFTYLIAGTVLMTTLTGVIISRDNKEKDDDDADDAVTTYSATSYSEPDRDESWETNYSEPDSDGSWETNYTDPPETESERQVITYGSGPETINLWSYSNDAPKIVEQYIKQMPEFGEKYTVECTIIPTDGGAYQRYLDQAIVAGGPLMPDIYFVDGDFAAKYTKGDLCKFAAEYKNLGIDVEKKIKEAKIAPYVVDVGTRDGKVVGLSYQSTAGVMIYNAEVAKAAFGTDDPAEIEKIFGAGTGSWSKFLAASETLNSKGYAVVSGYEDLWPLCDKSAEQPWIVDGTLTIDPERENYLDLARTIKNNGYSNDSVNWSENWYKDMKGEGNKKVFAYFGPAWLINYVMIGNCGGSVWGEGTFGHWRVCAPPAGFYWGGSWVLAHYATDHKEGVAELIEWITLDTSDTGLQYLWANGLIDWDNDPYTTSVQDAVASSAVMARSKWSEPFCGGQDLFPAFITGNKYSSGKAVTQYDTTIGRYFNYAAREYADKKMNKNEAIKYLRNEVRDNLSL